VIVCSPPGPNGQPSDVVLAAAAIAGADRVFAIGGAGAVAVHDGQWAGEGGGDADEQLI